MVRIIAAPSNLISIIVCFLKTAVLLNHVVNADTEISLINFKDQQQHFQNNNKPFSGKILRVIVINVHNLLCHLIFYFNRYWIIYYLQFPPLMIINRRPDGTVEYSGAAFEILDYNAKALDIRKVIILVAS